MSVYLDWHQLAEAPALLGGSPASLRVSGFGRPDTLTILDPLGPCAHCLCCSPILHCGEAATVLGAEAWRGGFALAAWTILSLGSPALKHGKERLLLGFQ